MLRYRYLRIPGAHCLGARYATTILSLVLVSALHVASVYAYILVKGKNRRPVVILFVLIALVVSNGNPGHRVFAADEHILSRQP